MKKLCTNFTRL